MKELKTFCKMIFMFIGYCHAAIFAMPMFAKFFGAKSVNWNYDAMDLFNLTGSIWIILMCSYVICNIKLDK